MPEAYSAAFSATIDTELRAHLIRADGQEDLCFALWMPSDGSTRRTALVHTIVLPRGGDRIVHGNVSFEQPYFERVCHDALRAEAGIAFLHSHPFPGWPSMSQDDVDAERRIAGAAASLTDLPLLGLTVGSDGVWSARIWEHEHGRMFRRRWCDSVRVTGERLHAYFADSQRPRPVRRELFRRTIDVYGEEAYAHIARLTVGIVGLGSVGAFVAELLAQMGIERLVLIDFDSVEPHNLDRTVLASEADLGLEKVEAAGRRLRQVATAASFDVRTVPFSVVEEEGYRAALDCDVVSAAWIARGQDRFSTTLHVVTSFR